MTRCLPVQALYNILLSDRRLLATIKAIKLGLFEPDGG